MAETPMERLVQVAQQSPEPPGAQLVKHQGWGFKHPKNEGKTRGE